MACLFLAGLVTVAHILAIKGSVSPHQVVSLTCYKKRRRLEDEDIQEILGKRRRLEDEDIQEILGYSEEVIHT